MSLLRPYAICAQVRPNEQMSDSYGWVNANTQSAGRSGGELHSTEVGVCTYRRSV